MPLGGNGKGDSQLRLVTADGNFVFPDDAELTDDSPTIISKNKSSEAIQTAPPSLAGSLRGRKLAHFELLEAIGVGGMAAVLRARDTQLERIVALKILPPEMAQDEENIRRFHQEARAAARLDHENIARVFFCGDDQRLHFIAFEYVEGVNLRVLLEQRGRLPVAEAVRIILQIAAGLEHAASRGVVHRDVKPSNIIISPNGRAKLVDMGLARSLEPHLDGALTQSGVTLGTFDYISPEQALEPREADSRSDIYSLGCTFYHMLTGQAPVPEGTAAKKLHHHQHLAPIDPRHFNPEIPDEVAAILVRMMAKGPKDRYQRPVHLVQHLFQVARKVGAAEDAPEGVLFVDAPLPGDPRKRPLLLVSLGALALALLLVLLSLAQPKGPVLANKLAGGAALSKADAPKEPIVPTPTRPRHNGEKISVGNAEKLEEALKEPGNTINIELTKTIELDTKSLTFQGDGKRHLTIESNSPGVQRAICFSYSPRVDQDPVIGLTLERGTVIFNNIKFEITVPRDTPEQVVASLGIRGAATVTFNKCVFVQKGVELQKLIPQGPTVKPVASIALDNPGSSERPKVILHQCSFTGGQVAVGINGPADIAVDECAFRPYGALLHLRGDQDAVALKLKHCSAFVVNGPAFRLDNSTRCNLDVEHSIFSCPMPVSLDDRDEPDLIRQTHNSDAAVVYRGIRNCYHNLNAMWVRGTDICTELDEFRTLVKAAGGYDQDSARLMKDTPIWASSTPLLDTSLRDAFKLLPNVREVRTADLAKPLGFETCEKIKMDPLPRFVSEDSKLATELKLQPNEKVVDPDGMDAPPYYKSLSQALGAAKPRDVIYIRPGKNRRDVLVKSVLLDRDADVTLKPYPNGSPGPILSMEKTFEPDAAFFRMFDGKITFEQLEFELLEPDQARFKGQSIVFMSGDAGCTFKNCVVTLRPSGGVRNQHAPLSLVTLADPEDVMRMPSQTPRSTPAEILLQDCLIRGEGDVVNVRGSRPLTLTANNTLVGLAGTFLTMQAGAKEPPQEPPVSLKLNHVSAFLTEPFLNFHVQPGKISKGFVPVKVETAQNSLFVSLADKPLVLLEGNDISDENIRNYLDWTGDHNAFCGFDSLMQVVRPGETQSVLTMGLASWLKAFKETDTKSLLEPFSFPAPTARFALDRAA